MRRRRALAALSGAALTLTVGCTPSVAAAPAHQLHIQGCEYLRDGASLGSAASAKPGHPPPNDIGVYQENAGAWRFGWTGGSGNTGSIYLCSAPDWHLTVFVDPTGHVGPDVYWAQLDCGGCSQAITLKTFGAEAFQVVFKGGKVLCAGGGVGSTDKAVIPQHCSDYHQGWDWDTSSRKGAGRIVYFPGRGQP